MPAATSCELRELPKCAARFCYKRAPLALRDIGARARRCGPAALQSDTRHARRDAPLPPCSTPALSPPRTDSCWASRTPTHARPHASARRCPRHSLCFRHAGARPPAAPTRAAMSTLAHRALLGAEAGAARPQLPSSAMLLPRPLPLGSCGGATAQRRTTAGSTTRPRPAAAAAAAASAVDALHIPQQGIQTDATQLIGNTPMVRARDTPWGQNGPTHPALRAAQEARVAAQVYLNSVSKGCVARIACKLELMEPCCR
jgi:hypothetical protein